ncbi:MAG: cyclic nucleotide-binding domain-containing protein [Pseudomonadota bacterium]
MNDILSPERVIDRLITQPMFADLDPVSLRVIALASERWSLDMGDDLFVEGDPSDSSYFVLDGVIIITGSDGHQRLVVKDDLLHPLALIADLPRPVTATAQTPCDLLKIPRAVFLRILENAPILASRVRDKLSRELVSAGKDLKLAEAAMAP